MTNAAITGLTAPADDLRAISAQAGVVPAQDGLHETFAVAGSGVAIVEGFRSGEDQLLLPAGTDLAGVTVASGWQDDAWGLRISYGSEGDSVFLRWGWQFDAARDLGVAGGQTGGETPGGDPPGGETPGGDTELPPLADGQRAISAQLGCVVAVSTQAETFAVSGTGVALVEGFRSGEDQLLLPAGTDLAGVTVASGWEDDAWGLRISYDAEGDCVFLRWGWQFDTARDLGVAGGQGGGDTPGGETPGGNTGVVTPPPPPGTGNVELGTGPDTLVLKVSSESYLGDAQFTVQVDGAQIGGVLTAQAAWGSGSDAVTLHGDWGATAAVTVTFLNDLWNGSAATDRNLHIDGATFNGAAVAGAAQTVWANYGVTFTAGDPAQPPAPPPPPGGNTGGDDTAPAGHTLVLSDDFSNGYDYDKWGWPFGGGVYWNGAFSWNSDDVGVRNGELQVTITQQADGWWTAGGFNSFKAGNAILYGKIEFDAKVPDEQGTMAAILTWPETDVWPRDGEIDILETPHDVNMFSTHYAGPDGEHWYDSIRSDTFDAEQWNHYEMTWLPYRLTIAVNGNVVAEWTDPAQIPDVPHGFGAMGFVGSWADQWMGGAPDASTPDQVVISIDNVRMYQLDGVI
jgi:hypothetical protein